MVARFERDRLLPGRAARQLFRVGRRAWTGKPDRSGSRIPGKCRASIRACRGMRGSGARSRAAAEPRHVLVPARSFRHNACWRLFWAGCGGTVYESAAAANFPRWK
jgi:hypothetical protein